MAGPADHKKAKRSRDLLLGGREQRAKKSRQQRQAAAPPADEALSAATVSAVSIESLPDTALELLLRLLGFPHRFTAAKGKEVCRCCVKKLGPLPCWPAGLEAPMSRPTARVLVQSAGAGGQQARVQCSAGLSKIETSLRL